jgi:hypothetical protein
MSALKRWKVASQRMEQYLLVRAQKLTSHQTSTPTCWTARRQKPVLRQDR